MTDEAKPVMKYSWYVQYYWKNKRGENMESYRTFDSSEDMETTAGVREMIKHIEENDTDGRPIIIRWWKKMPYVPLEPEDDKGGEHY